MRRFPLNQLVSVPDTLSRRSLMVSACAAAGALALPSTALAKSLTLKMNYFGDFAPFSFLQTGGVMAGIFVDALNEVLGRRGGVALTHQGLPWARAQNEIKEGQADAFCTLVNDARKEYVNFSKEALYRIGPVLCFAKNNPKADKIRQVTTIEGLKAYSFGSYIGDSRLDTIFKGQNINTVPDLKQVLLKIEANRSDLTVMPGPIQAMVARKLGISDKLETVPFPAMTADAYHLGIRKTLADGQQILALFDKLVVTARSDGTLDKILAQHG